jgi:hypothetical protein
MKTITMTQEQYNKIRQLMHFAKWYIDEHEGSSCDVQQWEEDRDEVTRGVQAINEIDQSIRTEIETLNLWNS